MTTTLVDLDHPIILIVCDNVVSVSRSALSQNIPKAKEPKEKPKVLQPANR
jgi:hypothetical protein